MQNLLAAVVQLTSGADRAHNLAQALASSLQPLAPPERPGRRDDDARPVFFVPLLVVPEPSSWSLAVIALLGLVAVRRRRGLTTSP